MQAVISDRFPVSHRLEDGASLTFSLMSSADRDELSRFITRLTGQDLSYLQIDITRPDIQDLWLESIARGESVSICAYDSAGLVGYASVQTSDDPRHGGEIRVNVSQGYRSRGLGRILISEIFNIAKHLKLDKVTARMLSDQHGARAAFGRLGFVKDQVLVGHVKDASSTVKDLLVMTATP